MDLTGQMSELPTKFTKRLLDGLTLWRQSSLCYGGEKKPFGNKYLMAQQVPAPSRSGSARSSPQSSVLSAFGLHNSDLKVSLLILLWSEDRPLPVAPEFQDSAVENE